MRIFNTYGPRLQMNDGRVISNFLTQALRGDDLTIYGDGSQTRSFCYVPMRSTGSLGSRAATSICRSILATRPSGRSWNARKLSCASPDQRARLPIGPLPQDDPLQRQPDISKARRLFSWEPKIDLETGLKLSLDYFKACVEVPAQA